MSSADDLAVMPGTRKAGKHRAIHDAGDRDKLPIEAPTAVVFDRKPSAGEKLVILSSLSRLFIFNNIDEDSKAQIVDCMVRLSVATGDYVFKEGQRSARYFMVESGEIELMLRGKTLNLLHEGEGFGELALLHDMPRAFTALATERSVLWSLDRHTFRRHLEEINSKVHKEKADLLRQVDFLAPLTHSMRDVLELSFSTRLFSPNSVICPIGNPSQELYVLCTGTAMCAGTKRRLVRGDYYGEASLLFSEAVLGELRAETQVKCLVISAEELERVLGDYYPRLLSHHLLQTAFHSTETYKHFNFTHIEKLVSCMQKTAFSQGNIVTFEQSTGVVKCLLRGRLKLGELMQFTGPVLLPQAEEHSIAMVASAEAEIAQWPKQVFTLCADSQVASPGISKFLWFFEKMPIFAGAQSTALEVISAEASQSLHAPGDYIINEFDPGNELYFIKSGLVEVLSQHRVIRVLGKFDYFGERALLLDSVRSASVRARVSTTCLRISKSDLLMQVLAPVRASLLSRIQQQDVSIQLNSLLPLAMLGKGMFGEVYLVEDQVTHQRYALKSVARKVIERYRLSTSLRNEREVLSQLLHPFLVSFYGSYKDDMKLYFLMEYVNGVDLFTAIRDIGLLSESDAQFYIGCLVLVLEHMHERDVLYRDLKPENVMLDEQGYPKLVDFGSAKWTTDRTYTVAGTPHYMAPEVISGKGYGPAADYWSLGIILYEFLCGGVPFGEEFTEPYDIYEQVLTGSLTFPPFVDSLYPAKTLMEQLLNRNPSRRLGGSVSMLKRTAWLRDVDWTGLIARTVSAPYVPGAQRLDTVENQSSDKTSDSADEASSPDLGWDQDF